MLNYLQVSNKCVCGNTAVIAGMLLCLHVGTLDYLKDTNVWLWGTLHYKQVSLTSMSVGTLHLSQGCYYVCLWER
jgi:hypothetical protein